MKCLLLLAFASVAVSSQVTPIQKVIQLMDNMKDKGTKEMVEEQTQFAAYKQFCKTTLDEKGKSIEEATEKMEVLEADIEKARLEIRRLGKEITEHVADIEKDTQESEQATTLRKKENKDFLVTQKDFSESIDALQRALKVLKTSDEKVSLSLVQLSAVRNLKNLPEDAMASIDAFLAQQEQQKQQQQPVAALLEKTSDAQAPQPHTYEFQSGGVVEMLEGLLDKFEDQRLELEKEESTSKHAYDLLVQRLAAQVAASKKEKAQKTEFKAKQTESQAAMKGELQETTEERSTDTKYKDDLKATCAKKASAFDARQKMRKEEIEAIDKAKEIIASGAVSGNAESLLQIRSKRSSLAFLRSENLASSPKQQEVARFLQQEASALSSRVLAAAATRVSNDPFLKVKNMIQGLITKMQNQLNDEAEKKGWCDNELAQNKHTREEKMDLVDGLESDKEELDSSISSLAKEVQTLGKEVTELTTAMREATELRLKEKNKNAATIRDAKEAQAAVAQALAVLKEFYSKAGEATAFLQSSSQGEEAPEIFGDEPYTGMAGESNGIVSMLGLIESDFAKLEAETAAEEEASKKEYEEFMEDSKIDKATKVKNVDFKSNKKKSKEQSFKTTEDDLHSANKELDAAKAYFEKLKEKCMESEASLAESKATREKEIADLKEALTMLNSLNVNR